ncbi:MAG: hypothetical protein J6X57_07365 [Bacteroidales bacterium]|nr:hypothetical protein [Bacteroidales bacterium]
MKKIIVSLASLMLIASMASGQTMMDALTFSQTNYYGTARTMGMGNAVTAIGGDLGSINVNPAGGAVSAYSQFTISTGWSTSSSTSAYAASYDSYDGSANFSGGFENNKTRMTIPNIGMNMYLETGNRSGLLGWNFGFVINRAQTYTSMMSASGLEGHTSMTGALATFANGMPGTILADPDNMFDSQYSWNSICAYDAGLINYKSDAGSFFGSAETVTASGTEYKYEMLGWLRQNIGTTTLGSRNDMVWNFGANIDNRLFLGFSLGIPMINYSYSEYYNEVSQDPADFPVKPEYYSKSKAAYVQGASTYYLGSTYKYNYIADIGGINAKVGVIWLPTNGLRLGAAIQTPTVLSINERWYIDVNSEFQDASQNASSSSPTAEAEYSFRAPYSANFGLAYTLGRSGLISFDYELIDFSVMKFSEIYEDASYSYADPFYRVNRLNNLFCGVQHNLRVGAEIRVLPSLSLRAGYNMSTNPQRHYTDNTGVIVDAAEYDAWFSDFENGTYTLVDGSAAYSKDRVTSISFGAGYSSPGSFYVDIAFRRTSLPDTHYSPYSNYLSHSVGGKVYDIVSPQVRTSNSLFDAVVTFGWRF